MNKKILKFFELTFAVVLSLMSARLALAANVNLTVRDGTSVVFSGAVTLPTSVISLNDADGAPHTIDANSALAVLASADETSSDFSISNLSYYSSFNSLYLKCLTDANGEKCDNWQYTVNDVYSSVGMDQNILSGGENIYIYFGPQNKIILSSGNMNINDTLTVSAQKYDYQNDTWAPRTGVTVGLTRPDPNNPWSPIEVKTTAVDSNGQAVFSPIPAGSYNIGIKEDFYFPTETLTVTTPPPSSNPEAFGSAPCCSSASASDAISIPPAPTNHSNGHGSILPAVTPQPPVLIKTKFDLKKAFDFLIARQKENGSFGEDLYTDWATMALASGNYQDQIKKLVKYFEESKITGTLVTDYERHAIALLSLGLNPYNTGKENYIEKIVASFDGKQFGDTNEDNDDIFALIVLQNAGYARDEKMISDDISFILNRQKENGSFDESVDMTGAAIEALSAFNQNEQVKKALDKAKNFLKQSQKDDGGWGNASGTAWAMEGILAMNEKPANIAISDTPEHFDLQNVFGEDWIKNNNSPLDYLGTIQDADGGIKNLPAGSEGENIQNKIWETAYVASALSGKTWNQIMQKFEKSKEGTTNAKENRGNKLEEKTSKPAVVKIIAKKHSQNTEIAKVPNKEKKGNEILKPENLASQNTNQNTATALMAIENSPAQKTEASKRNWFLRFLDKIFSIF